MLLSELSMGHAAGRAAALKGLGSTPLRTRHRPTHPTDSPDRDSRRSVALKRAQGAPQRPYSGSLGFPGAGSTWARPRFAPATSPGTTRTLPTEIAGDMGCLIALRGGGKSHTQARWVSRVQRAPPTPMAQGPVGLKELLKGA